MPQTKKKDNHYLLVKLNARDWKYLKGFGNKLALLILLQFSLVHSQSLSSLSGLYFGLKVGANYCIRDLSERFVDHSGMGLHGGINIGFDIQPHIVVNIAPQIKLSSYLTEHVPGEDIHYTNLYIPALVSLRLLPGQSTSPYLGIGLAMNFQLHGKAVDPETGSKRPIENLQNDFYFATCFGIEKELARFKISPEFSFNYDLTSDDLTTDIPVSIYDFSLAIGLFYAL